MVSELLALVSLEFVTFAVCAQALIWLIVDPPLPTSDPYIPRAKRPPSYLGPFLSKINSAIDSFVDSIVPRLPSNRRHPAQRFRCDTSSSSKDNVRVRWILVHVRVTLSVLFWSANYLFCKWHFSWWRVRNRPPSRSRRKTAIAHSAVTAGVARATSALPVRKPGRAIFDSDSFDILVDGGATACISNDLNDFVSTPLPSSVRVKGFNGTTSSTQIGTVQRPILDDAGRRHVIRIPNTYYVPASGMPPPPTVTPALQSSHQ